MVRIKLSVIILALLLSFVSNEGATIYFNHIVAFLTPYYYNRGKPLPEKVRVCLCKCGINRKLVDKIRYIENAEDFFFKDESHIGRCLGNLVVFKYDEVSYLSFYIVIHEVWHSKQVHEMGKVKFLIEYVAQSIRKIMLGKPVDSIGIETEARKAELCSKCDL